MLEPVRLLAPSLLLLSSLLGCASSPAVFADGMTVPISLVNRTGETICFLYLSPINDDSWTGDVLGSATVPEGATRTIRVPPGNWDVRIENCQHEGGSILRGARIARGSALVLQ